MLNYLPVFLIALFLSLALISLLRRLAVKINLVSPQDVTYLGGLGMWLTLLVICILAGLTYGYLHKPTLGIILGLALEPRA